ncbi:ATP-dependent DNA helicase Chl1p [[Candida] railenensis]|uniref:ATP-dependent DNA helicase CHL1 n=1 Tax=[Candida] railenensis TaxID=45579 RepID=A0A9P0VX10_9ASCO|nr:ATP-dependent DNA helicase Chl1p [[Candida] railenensis]
MKNRLLNDSEHFGHPYVPYKIQIELMKEIYSCIENGCKIGIFESPTGTGKTLSLICSTMTWLRDFKKESIIQETKRNDDDDEDNVSDDEPDWVKAAYADSILKRSSSLAKDYELHLDSIESQTKNRIQKIHTLKDQEKKRFKKSSVVLKESEPGELDSSFVPDDYYSDSEISSNKNINDQMSSQVKQLLTKVNGPKETVELVNTCPTTIYYSSRTHSQLNQFAQQLKLTSFESSFVNVAERTKFLPLASRKQLCINPKVSKLKDLTSINDACMDLQKSDSTSCEFIPKAGHPLSEELTKEFVDTSFTSIHDIEDLVAIGSSLKICPYYSVRKGVELSEIIALPYQMILQDSTRRSLNLNIDNAIVIIDEAHNLFDVITSIYSVNLLESDIILVINSLKAYLKKFSPRLNSGNRINLMKLIKLCSVLKSFMEKAKSTEIVPGKEIFIDEIFKGTTGDTVNVHNIEKFLTKSKIAYKVQGWIDKQQELSLSPNSAPSSSSSPLLFKITSFLKSLANPSKEGKFFWDKPTKSTISINYMLLDPSSIFKDIVTRAKCVILCGGTMEPMSDYTNYLFPYISKELIRNFSCKHVIPDSNLHVFPLGTFRNQEFNFQFGTRNNPTMIENLGLCILRICQAVPHGVVVFFPSYKYLEEVLEQWKGKTLLYEKLSSIKTILTEPQNSSDVDSVLTKYSKAIYTENRGSILLSVVGGKLSEGINFSDELARAVVMVGLPFPNAYSGEMVARMKYIEADTISKGGTPAMGREATRQFYENICMRAVNQSIGRSIRHINDYSILYLIDGRYGNPGIQKKLSGWVKEQLPQQVPNQGGCIDFESAMQLTTEFFEVHGDKQVEIRKL